LNQISTYEKLKEDQHNLASKRKQTTHPMKIIKVFIKQEYKTTRKENVPNLSLFIRHHKNMGIGGKKGKKTIKMSVVFLRMTVLKTNLFLYHIFNKVDLCK
jgi:hypothetical protein